MLTGTRSMQKELGMNSHNNAYTIVSVVFFFTYAIGQPPATVLIRKIGPRLFLAFIVFGWGVVMIVSKLSTSACRCGHRPSWLTSLGRASVSSTRGKS
jgi:MFS family permease